MVVVCKDGSSHDKGCRDNQCEEDKTWGENLSAIQLYINKSFTPFLSFQLALGISLKHPFDIKQHRLNTKNKLSFTLFIPDPGPTPRSNKSSISQVISQPPQMMRGQRDKIKKGKG